MWWRVFNIQQVFSLGVEQELESSLLYQDGQATNGHSFIHSIIPKATIANYLRRTSTKCPTISSQVASFLPNLHRWFLRNAHQLLGSPAFDPDPRHWQVSPPLHQPSLDAPEHPFLPRLSIRQVRPLFRRHALSDMSSASEHRRFSSFAALLYLDWSVRYVACTPPSTEQRMREDLLGKTSVAEAVRRRARCGESFLWRWKEQGRTVCPKRSDLLARGFGKTQQIVILTSVIQTWIERFVRNQYMKLPSGGIMWGYCLIFCSSVCWAESEGPGYCRGAFDLRRAPWDGGLNLAGFSSTIGLDGGDFLEACLHWGNLTRAAGEVLSTIWG